MKLCMFPNDPIRAYYQKGVIKPRYYNPNNIFNEIHVISPSERDITVEMIQESFGTAKVQIHNVGKFTLLNRFRKKNQVLRIVQSIKPDVIRSYSPLVGGWIAAYCSKKLHIPFFLSLHIQYDGLRKLVKSKNYKKYLALKYSRKFIEPFVLTNADKIIAVYKIIEPYVQELCGKNPEILYNKVDLSQFQDGKKISSYDKPLILSVGRLTPQKNHECLIRAVKNLDVYLQIIGDGEQKEYLIDLVKKLGMENKIMFKDSVQNKQIQDYYKTADLFALGYDPEIEGVPIPVFEAMAAGLPIVISKPNPKFSDGLEGAVVYSSIDPQSFASEIRKILTDKIYAQTLSDHALSKAKEFDGNIMEKREASIYKELLKTGK